MPTTLLMTLMLLAAPAEELPRDDGGGLVAVGLRVGGGSWTYDYAAPLVGIGLNAGHRHRALEAGVTVGLHWLSANLDLYGKLWLGRLNLSVGAGVNVIQLVSGGPLRVPRSRVRLRLRSIAQRPERGTRGAAGAESHRLRCVPSTAADPPARLSVRSRPVAGARHSARPFPF